MTTSNFFRALCAISVMTLPALARAFLTDDPPYLKPVAPSVKITPLLTVGEAVPRTSNATQSFRLIGLPSGLGAFKDAKGRAHLLVSHQLKKTAVSQPVAGSPLSNGPLISEYLMTPSPPDVLSGDFAATTILDGTNGLPKSGVPGAWASGFMAGDGFGLDRTFYLTGEGDTGTATLDGRGGQTFALFDGILAPLPDLGHFQKSKAILIPNTGLKTVVLGLEDGPKGYHSQLTLYVGDKKLSSKNALERNGLLGGTLYTFAADDVGLKDESGFHKRDEAIPGRWVRIGNAATKTETELDQSLDDAGAFHFDRLKDGTFDRFNNTALYFVTEGGDADGNRKGRLYRLTFDPANPTAGRVILEILLEGDAGDPLTNPNSLDMNKLGEMLISEDNPQKNSSLWLYRPGGQGLTKLAEISEKAWTPSGVTDASDAFGRGAWLVAVQAHTIGSAEASKRQNISGDGYVIEGGQIDLLTLP